METPVAVGLLFAVLVLSAALAFGAWATKAAFAIVREQLERLREENHALLDRIQSRDLAEYTNAQIARGSMVQQPVIPNFDRLNSSPLPADPGVNSLYDDRPL